jgi:amino acid transporter
MGRAGALPRPLAKLSVHRTPSAAIVFQTVVNVVIGVLMIKAVGLYNVFNFTGLMFVFALTFVYLLGNVCVWRLYRGDPDFSVVKHVAIPVIGIAALLLVAYESLNPFPESPLNWALPVVLIWFVVGIGVLVVRDVASGREWLQRDMSPDAMLPDEVQAGVAGR